MRAVRPAHLGHALELLGERSADEPLVPLAGGTDLLVHWPVRPEARDRDYLDLTPLGDLRGVRWSGGALELGALASYWDVIADRRANEELPILVASARQVGAVQIQSRGTWAGNIVNGSPAADGVPVLMACEAVVVLASCREVREVPLDRYYSGYREGARRHDELITAIRIPRMRRSLQRFVKVGPRRAQAIAKVGLAVTRSDAGWRVVAASVAPTVRRCPAVERLLDENAMPNAPEDLDAALRADVSPIDDIRSTAAYRARVLGRVLYDAVRDGVEQSG
ncbi:MAG TPA: FAD binding domain-containing protein [Gemmatimonadota bacterium]|nr:FAD binding domain-containing protein [Gemmatimonadota bacterium]